MRRFEGKNVVVTGASSGIGWAIAHAFVDEGARIYAVARRGERLERMRASSSAPESVQVSVVDVGVPEQARQMVRDAIAAMGRVHVLVNNAAIMPYGPVLDISEQTWRDTYAVNLDGPFYASQVAARHMAESGGGVIINIASANAFRVESPAANYNSSKAALVMMTRCFAHELGHLGVRANCVAPGQTWTPEAQEELAPRGLPPRVRGVLQPRSPPAPRTSRGAGERRALPGLGRGVLHQRRDHPRRRWRAHRRVVRPGRQPAGPGPVGADVARASKTEARAP